jgi:hypothetical protein
MARLKKLRLEKEAAEKLALASRAATMPSAQFFHNFQYANAGELAGRIVFLLAPVPASSLCPLLGGERMEAEWTTDIGS